MDARPKSPTHLQMHRIFANAIKRCERRKEKLPTDLLIAFVQADLAVRHEIGSRKGEAAAMSWRENWAQTHPHSRT